MTTGVFFCVDARIDGGLFIIVPITAFVGNVDIVYYTPRDPPAVTAVITGLGEVVVFFTRFIVEKLGKNWSWAEFLALLLVFIFSSPVEGC